MLKTFNASGCNDTSCSSNSIILASSAWPLVAVVLVSILLVVTMILTVVGNTVTIAVLATWGTVKQFVNIETLISLAVADSLVGTVVMPCAVDSVVSGQWRCGEFWGTFNGFANFFFCISSIMHLMVLSLDRYVAINYPLMYPKIITKKRSIVICVGLWIYSAIWALLPLFKVSSYECFIPYIGVCKQEDWSGEKSGGFLFAILVVSTTYGVAVLVICYTYTRILFVIFKQVKQINQTTRSIHTTKNRPQKVSSKKGVLTLLSVIILYLVSWSPYCVLTAFEIAKGKKLSTTASMITMFIGFANSMCNPIIYAIKYSGFRKRMFKFLFRMRTWARQLRPSSRVAVSPRSGIMKYKESTSGGHNTVSEDLHSLNGSQSPKFKRTNDSGKEQNENILPIAEHFQRKLQIEVKKEDSVIFENASREVLKFSNTGSLN